ncbi:MAG: hypothetical protein AAFY05_13965 [Pseudomonadota bacterium]
MARAITTQQDFLEHVAGRRLILEDSWVIITPQGGVEGVGPDRKAITGTWSWSDTYYCRSIFFGGKDLPEDFQTVTLAGDKVSFVHDRGHGETITWTIT